MFYIITKVSKVTREDIDIYIIDSPLECYFLILYVTVQRVTLSSCEILSMYTSRLL